jgi:hypothetical protein
MSASAHRYSCEDLGVCQSRNTPCSGCSAHPFAPGAIEHHTRTRTWREELTRWLIGAAIALACAISIGLLAGLASRYTAGA